MVAWVSYVMLVNIFLYFEHMLGISLAKLSAYTRYFPVYPLGGSHPISFLFNPIFQTFYNLIYHIIDFSLKLIHKI